MLGQNSATGAVAPRGRLLSLSAVVSLSDSLSAATSYLSMTHPFPPSLVISLLSRAGRGALYRRDALEAIFSALYWTLEKQCSNYLGFTTSPCLPLTQMKSHLKAWMPNVFTNPFIKGRICNSDTKRPALTSIGRRKVSAHSCEHLVTGTGDNCPFSLLY